MTNRVEAVLPDRVECVKSIRLEIAAFWKGDRVYAPYAAMSRARRIA